MDINTDGRVAALIAQHGSPVEKGLKLDRDVVID